jgi:hypothetical protein
MSLSPSDLEILNRRARMSPEERDEDIVREMFGPLFNSIFGAIPKPDAPAETEESK